MQQRKFYTLALSVHGKEFFLIGYLRSVEQAFISSAFHFQFVTTFPQLAVIHLKYGNNMFT